jgi:mercuric ion binding protein
MTVTVLNPGNQARYWLSLALATAALVVFGPTPGGWAQASQAQPSQETRQAATSREAVVEANGMSCPFCAYGIKKHLLRLPGAKKVEVDLGKDQAIVDFAPDSKVTDEQIKKAVRDAGFKPGRIEWRNQGNT